MARHQRRSIDPWTAVIALALLVLFAALAQRIFIQRSARDAVLYFFGTPQADAALAILPSGAKILIDCGPDDSAMLDLARVLPYGENYIDIAIISSPQIKYFGGANHILDHYRVGAFVYGGRDAYYPDTKAWTALVTKIKSKNIPFIPIGKGDTLRFAGATATVIFPDPDFAASAALEDAALATNIKTAGFTALFAGAMDVNAAAEVLSGSGSRKTDIVSIADNFMKESSSRQFLQSIGARWTILDGQAKGVVSSSANQGMISPKKGDILEVSTIKGHLQEFLLYN
jgi:beta-lactamase superfamily II metal-dependent hydrolase